MKIATVFWHEKGKTYIEEFMFLKEVGFDGVEVTVSEMNEKTPPLSARGYLRFEVLKDDAKRLLEASKEVGLDIHSVRSGLLWKYSLTASDPNVRRKAISIVEKELEICSYLGATALLVVPGVVTEDIPYDKAYEISLRSIKELSKKAEKEDVFLCIENVENNFLLSPLEMRNFIDEVGSEKVGVYLDIGNVLACHQAYPQHWISILGKRIKKVHVKDYNIRLKSITYPFQGNVNWPSVIEALKKVGYDDYLTAELTPYKLFPEKFFKDLAETMKIIIKLLG